MTEPSPAPRGAAVITVAVCTALMIGLFLTPKLSNFYFAGNIADNMRYFHDYSARIAAGGVPYRDFPVEYPPVTTATLALLAPFSASFERYAPAFLLMNLALWLLCMALVMKVAGRLGASPHVAAALFTFLSMAAGPIMMVSLDLVPALLTMASLAALTSGRRGLAFAALGAAAAAKGYPILLLPLFLMVGRMGFANKQIELDEDEVSHDTNPDLRVFPSAVNLAGWKPAPPDRNAENVGEVSNLTEPEAKTHEYENANPIRRGLRDIAAFGGAFLVLGCLPAIFSVKNFVGSYVYHSERGLEVASVYSALLIPLRHAGLAMHTQFDHNSWNLVVPGVSGPLARVSVIIQLAFLFVALFVAWRTLRGGRADARMVAHLAAAVVLAFLIPFKVASPQYIVWLLPLAAVAWVEPFRWAPVMLCFVVGHLQQWIYPWNWFRLVNMSTTAASVLLFEKGLLIVLFVWCLATAGERRDGKIEK